MTLYNSDFKVVDMNLIFKLTLCKTDFVHTIEWQTLQILLIPSNYNSTNSLLLSLMIFKSFVKPTYIAFLCPISIDRIYLILIDSFTKFHVLIGKLPEGSSKINSLSLNRCPPYTEIFSKRRKIYSVCVESLSMTLSLTWKQSAES